MMTDGVDIAVDDADEQTAPSSTRPEDFSDSTIRKAKWKKYAPYIAGGILVVIFAAMTIIKKGQTSGATSGGNSATVTPDPNQVSSTDLTGLETQLSQQYSQTQNQISDIGTQIDQIYQTINGSHTNPQPTSPSQPSTGSNSPPVSHPAPPTPIVNPTPPTPTVPSQPPIVSGVSGQLNTLQKQINVDANRYGKQYMGSSTQIDQHLQKIKDATKLGYSVDSSGYIFDGGKNRVSIPVIATKPTVSAFDQLKALQGTINLAASGQGRGFQGSVNQVSLHQQKIDLANKLGYSVSADGTVTDKKGNKINLN